MNTKKIFKEIFHSDNFLSDGRISKKAESVSIAGGEGKLLFAKLYRANQPERTVIIYQNAGNDFLKTVIELLGDECNILVPEKNREDISTFGIKERYECFKWTEFVKDNISSALPVYLYGIGTVGTTVLMTGGMNLSSQVHGIIADSCCSAPYDFVNYSLKTKYGEEKGERYSDKLDRLLMKKHSFSMHEYTVKEAMKSCTRPVLFFHGRKDKTVPFSMAEDNYNCCMAEKEAVVFENSEHIKGLYNDPDCYLDKFNCFFRKYDRREFFDKIS